MTLRLLALLLLAIALPTLAQQARVVDVHDGDTVRLADGQRVRLWGIDAPELKQPFGRESRDHLAHMVEGRTVRLQGHGEDRYGRLLAVVWVGEHSANEDLLRAGLAWWYRKYTPDEKHYAQLEAEARGRHVGLWAQRTPLAPWDFRHPENWKENK